MEPCGCWEGLDPQPSLHPRSSKQHKGISVLDAGLTGSALWIEPMSSPAKKLISFTELRQLSTKLSRILDESHFRNLQNSFLQPFPICFKHQFEVVLASWAPMAPSSETSSVPREHSPSLGTWTRAHRISCRAVP